MRRSLGAPNEASSFLPEVVGPMAMRGAGTGRGRAQLSMAPSAPLEDDATNSTGSWIGKLSKFLKSISAVDSAQRDRAVAATSAAPSEKQSAQSPATQPSVASPGCESPTDRLSPNGVYDSRLSPGGRSSGGSLALGGVAAATAMGSGSKLGKMLSVLSRTSSKQVSGEHPQPAVAPTTAPRESPSGTADRGSAGSASVQFVTPKPSPNPRASPPLKPKPLPAQRAQPQQGRPRAPGTQMLSRSEYMPPGMDREHWCLQDYSDMKELCRGYASEVYRATCRYTGHTVVLKIYHPDRLHEISQYQLLREARLHAQLHHPNIIQLYAAFQQEEVVALVMEYADQDDLLKLLMKQARLTELTTSRLVIAPLLKALSYLHGKAIIHRDVKLENVLFTGPEMTLKLADFGLCLNLQEERSVTRAGTLDYMAPEVLKCPTKNCLEDNKSRLDLAYNCSVDIWAVGVVAYELLHGMPPFSRMDRTETERLIMSSWQPPFLVHASANCQSFIYSCLTRSSHDRPSAFELSRHPWITALTRSTPQVATAAAVLPSIGQSTSSESISSVGPSGSTSPPARVSAPPASQPQPHLLQKQAHHPALVLRQPHAPIRPQQLQPRPLGRLNSSLTPLPRSSVDMLVKDWSDPPVARIQQQTSLPRTSGPDSASPETLPLSSLPTPFEALANTSCGDPLPPNVIPESSSSTHLDTAEGSRVLSRSQNNSIKRAYLERVSTIDREAAERRAGRLITSASTPKPMMFGSKLEGGEGSGRVPKMASVPVPRSSAGASSNSSSHGTSFGY